MSERDNRWLKNGCIDEKSWAREPNYTIECDVEAYSSEKKFINTYNADILLN